MFAKKIVPLLLVVGVVHMLMRHAEYNHGEQPAADGDQVHRSHFRHGPFGQRGPWANRVPPMFEMLHNRAHAAQAAQQPTASTPAI